MLNNPFTPLFGGKPSSFFGRAELLARFDRALQVAGSDDRVLFVTGTRGCGKTALIEQFSQHAAKVGWRTIDIGAEHALASLYRALLPYDDATVTIDPSLEVKVLGSGGSLSGKSTAKTRRFSIDDLPSLLQQECARQKNGLFVSIDEIQKVPLADMARICEAFQMASRKGHDVALAVAGLPYSHGAIIHQDGCTFMRRSVHEKLNLLSASEVHEAYLETFSQIKQLAVQEKALQLLVSHSSGHPYMMQLLGYHLVETMSRCEAKRITVAEEDVEAVAPVALAAYERRSLKPLLDEFSEAERRYLTAMAEVADEAYISRTADIASHMNRTAQQVSGARRKLIDHGIIVPVDFGTVRFNVPYLRAFVLKPTEAEANLEQLEAWGV